MKAVADARRSGDTNEMLATIAEEMKTIGNSSFGRTGMDKNKHSKVCFTTEDKAKQVVNKTDFKDLNELNGWN